MFSYDVNIHFSSHYLTKAIKIHFSHNTKFFPSINSRTVLWNATYRMFVLEPILHSVREEPDGRLIQKKYVTPVIVDMILSPLYSLLHLQSCQHWRRNGELLTKPMAT